MCGYRYSGKNRLAKAGGLVLMAAGLLLVLISLPGWMWFTLVGILLISIGYLIWRFC